MTIARLLYIRLVGEVGSDLGRSRWEGMVWQLFATLHEMSALLPGFETPQGAEVLLWVLKQDRRPRLLKDLYRSSRFSEPTLRKCLMRLVDGGFVSIDAGKDDERQRCVRPTPKLILAAEHYRALFIKAAQAYALSPIAVPPKTGAVVEAQAVVTAPASSAMTP